MDYYIIGYDLNKSGQDYNRLYRRIKSTGDWWHSLGSTWIVKSDKTADEIHESIAEVIDDNDELLVALLCDEVAWSGFVDKGGKWLEDNFYDCKKHGSKRKCKDEDNSKPKQGKGHEEGHGFGNDENKDKSNSKSKESSKCKDEDKDKGNSKPKQGKGHEEGHGLGNDENKSKKSSKKKK